MTAELQVHLKHLLAKEPALTRTLSNNNGV